MPECKICQKESELISRSISLCLNCIRNFEGIYEYVEEVHRPGREEYNLPLRIPDCEEGLSCKICGNNCQISEGEYGFCGLRRRIDNRIKGPKPERANLLYYRDSLPTNCVASWVCPATGSAYPEYSYTAGPEYGYQNLAIFYQGCSFDCLFCQNWQHRQGVSHPHWVSIEEILSGLDENVACICYFGGDPGPQILNSILLSQRAKAIKPGRILRFCWETNGNLNRKYLDEILKLALQSGGCIKFDLKAYNHNLHYLLTGVSNLATFHNFSYLAKFFNLRKNPPLLLASTLLVPGYLDKEEVYQIAKFIAQLNPEIPYSLLAFSPQYYLSDLPPTSKTQAYECLQSAHSAGLKKVKIGNMHLLR